MLIVDRDIHTFHLTGVESSSIDIIQRILGWLSLQKLSSEGGFVKFPTLNGQQHTYIWNMNKAKKIYNTVTET